MKKAVLFIAILLLPGMACSDDLSYRKIDDNTVEIITTKQESQVISLQELKNRAIDIEANIQYRTENCQAEQAKLQLDLEEMNAKITEAEKLIGSNAGNIVK